MSFQTFEPTQTQLRMLEMAGEVGSLCAVFELESGVDARRLAGAVQDVVSRCAVFSHRMLRIDGVPRIIASREDREGLTVIDATAGAQAAQTSPDALIRGITGRRFRLDGGAPYLFCLVKTRGADHLVFVCHPALADRFSLRPLFAALSRAYDGDLEPVELGLDQEELVRAERALLDGEKFAESVRFWLQLVRDTAFEWHPPRLESDIGDNSFEVSLSPARTQALAALARRLGIRTGDLLLFCFHIFMSRLTLSESVVTTYTHRIRTGRQGGIGFNENKPAFKSEVRADFTVGRYLNQVSRLFMMTRRHSDIPAREIAREIARQEPQFKRITNVLVAEDTLPYGELVLAGARARLLVRFSHRLDIEDVAIRFDIRDRITFHATTRSAQETSGLKMAMAHYLAILDHIDEDLDKPLTALRCFTPQLEARSLALAQGAPLAIPARDVIACFDDSAARWPQAPAVRFRDRRLTYGELHRTAMAVAAGLRPHLAAANEPLVGICLPRSERMVQSIFGTLAAGAAYVPLDPQMPADRMAFVVADARLAAMIVDDQTRASLESIAGLTLLAVDELLATPITAAPSAPATAGRSPSNSGAALPPCPGASPPADRAAYVIYTSGTTGKPKGVVVERGNLAHLLASLQGIWDRGPGTRWMQFASFTFDASVLGLFNPLVHGAEIILAPPEVRTDPEAIFNLLKEAEITHADLPPAMLPLLPRRPLPHLKVIFCGGEAIDEEAVRFWSKAVQLANCYGPTEATVMCTVNTMGGFKAATHLGRPIPGYLTYLRTDDATPALLGGVGEICVGGAGVARGYLGRPELTAQKFVPDSAGSGRVYRTGDLARYLPNGDLEFLGRRDFQVKIRGFRIELGDIEAAIAEQPEVKGAHVGVVAGDTGKSLVAWYVSRTLNEETLRERLSRRLPYYMVPAFLVRVDAFALTIAGKIDRARLPAPSTSARAPGEERLDEFQQCVREVWAAVLKLAPDAIGLDGQFFHLGGHSLLAALACNRLTRALGRDVRPKTVFEHPVLADFCEQLRALPQGQPALAPLVPTAKLATPVESRLIGLIYSRAMSVPDDNTYNIVSRVDFWAGIDAVGLARALDGLFADNPIFRVAFSERDGRIWNEASQGPLPQVAVIDATDADIERRAQELRREAFGISPAPLWRALIGRLPDGRVTLLFAIHHVIFDGWSLNLFVEELAARYEAQTAGTRYTRVRLTWFDHCIWSLGLSASRPFVESVAYWRKKLAGADARVELPVAHAQKRANCNASGDLRFEPETVAALRRLADAQGITLSPLLFALFLVWIFRISNQEELVCGYPYAGRDVPGTEEIYGSFVTMGFLRQRVRPDEDLTALAKAVHAQMIDDKEHLVAAPYDAEIANADALNVIFSLQSGINLEGKVGPSRFKAHEYPSLTSKGDIAGIFYETSDGALEGRVEYDASLLDDDSMAGFIRALGLIVESAAARPQSRVAELSYQHRGALDRFLEFATGPALAVPEESIPERFSQIVRAHPEGIAVEFEGRRLTYAQLDRVSDAIAALVAAREAPGSLVGLSFQKSDTAIAAILGVLKSGCAYVPLDPEYPPERLRFFAQNCNLGIVVADAVSAAALERAGLTGLTYLDPADAGADLPGDHLPGNASNAPARPIPPARTEGRPPQPAAERVPPDALAYVIHTSGSTGQPKGVMIEHRTVVRMVRGSVMVSGLDSTHRTTLISSLSFDTSVLEIFQPLLTGATLIVVPERVRKDPARLHAFLSESRATHVDCSPVLIQGMPRKTWPQLEKLSFGGDTIDEATAAWWSRATRLVTLYGPTEITVQCTAGLIEPGANHRVIGRPLPGYRVYLLNGRRQPVPMGAVGEICVGGDNLARGYLGRDDLTLERFVSDPFGSSPYDLIYLTGDMGRFLPDGTIEFLGRRDGQVKVRGYRIELGEIENRLCTMPGLEAAACAVRGEGDARMLVAYYVASQELAEAGLRAHLSSVLPDYMVPSLFVRLERLPLSPAGKIDRKALPVVASKTCANPPRPGSERAIAQVWESVLRFQGIGRDESFFQVGGNSLLAVRLQAELRRRLGMELSIADLYATPTIEGLASGRKSRFVQQAERDATEPLEPPEWPEPPRPRGAGSDPGSVLLTGGAGFLGIFLLGELLARGRRVVALVRAADSRAGAELLSRQARAAGVAVDLGRVEVVPCDLAAPALALASGVRARLAGSVDAIIHCGAFVHHLHGYQTMSPANVRGTRELLKLALEERAKRFCLISTMGVAHATGEGARADEASLPNTPVIDGGYILTKWVAERLVARVAGAYGIPALIARPGNITGSTSTGFTNYANNHFWLFNKGCLQLGHFPDTGSTVEMMPVDVLARAIVALALSSRKEGGLLIANLTNPRQIDQSAFFEMASAEGLRASPLAVHAWQRLVAAVGEDNGLSTIKDLYAGDLGGATPPIEQTATLSRLAELGVSLDADYASLVPVYLRYLRAQGFLPSP